MGKGENIKAERSWREGGAPPPQMPSRSPQDTARTSVGTKRTVGASSTVGTVRGDGTVKSVRGKGRPGESAGSVEGGDAKTDGVDASTASKGWGDTKIEGRPTDEEFNYDDYAYSEGGSYDSYENYDTMLENSALTTTDPGERDSEKKLPHIIRHIRYDTHPLGRWIPDNLSKTSQMIDLNDGLMLRSEDLAIWACVRTYL